MTLATSLDPTATPIRQSSVRTASLTSGLALAAMTVLAPIGVLVALPAGRTGIAAIIVLTVAMLDVVVALGLQPVLARGGELLSRTASALRIVYAAVFAAAAGGLVGPGADVDRFRATWDMGLVVFAGHLILVGVALVRAAGLPTWLGALVLLSGLGYLADGVTVALTAQSGVVGQFTFIGEVALCLWLIGWSGRRSR